MTSCVRDTDGYCLEHSAYCATEGAPVAGTADPWAPVDLAALWDDLDAQAETPTVLPVRGEGVGLLYPRKTNALFGESGAGKTWVGLAALVGVLAAGDRVVVLDFEDTAHAFVRRLKLLGVPRDRLPLVAYVSQPSTPVTPEGWARLVTPQPPPAAVLLDGVTGWFTLHGLDLDSATDVERFAAWLRVPEQAGACVITIDQTAKSRDGRGYALGSQHKRSAASGAVLRVDPVEDRAFHPHRGGAVSLHVVKDRPGGLRARQGTEVAQVVMEPDHRAGLLRVTALPGTGWLR